MATESAGLWFVGTGAFLLALVGLAGGPRTRLHLMFGGSGDERRERLTFAASGAGLLSTAVGSVLVAISSTPTVPYAAGTAVAIALIIYVLLVWKVHALWIQRRCEAAEQLSVNQDSRREQWRLDAAARCARWRWALTHPLTPSDGTSWPSQDLEPCLGPEPSGPPESPEDPLIALKLRQNRPNVARLSDGDTPAWLRDIVLVARDSHWEVLRSDLHLAFYTPDRASVELAGMAEPLPLVQALERERLLRALAAHGLPTHRASRGHSMPGRDVGHLITVLDAHSQHEEESFVPS